MSTIVAKRGRGRPKLPKTLEREAAEALALASGVVIEKRKRGRPRKVVPNNVEAAVGDMGTGLEGESPKKRGRPPKNRNLTAHPVAQGGLQLTSPLTWTSPDVAPVAPVALVAPVAPVALVAPITPLAPVAFEGVQTSTNPQVPISASPTTEEPLTNPLIPSEVAPVAPVTSVTPVTPVFATAPFTPVLATAPVASVAPVSPVAFEEVQTSTNPQVQISAPLATEEPSTVPLISSEVASLALVAPVTPVTPVAAIAPLIPVVAPVAPVTPVTATAPVTPVTATAPVTPVAATAPFTSVFATAPVASVVPVSPVAFEGVQTSTNPQVPISAPPTTEESSKDTSEPPIEVGSDVTASPTIWHPVAMRPIVTIPTSTGGTCCPFEASLVPQALTIRQPACSRNTVVMPSNGSAFTMFARRPCFPEMFPNDTVVVTDSYTTEYLAVQNKSVEAAMAETASTSSTSPLVLMYSDVVWDQMVPFVSQHSIFESSSLSFFHNAPNAVTYNMNFGDVGYAAELPDVDEVEEGEGEDEEDADDTAGDETGEFGSVGSLTDIAEIDLEDFFQAIDTFVASDEELANAGQRIPMAVRREPAGEAEQLVGSSSTS